MERRGQERDMFGMQYNPPEVTQESSSIKQLPLAPLLATSSDRRLSSGIRRGSSIFSPTQIANNPPPHFRRHLNPLGLQQDEPTEDPDPDPAPELAPPAVGASTSKSPQSQTQAAPPLPAAAEAAIDTPASSIRFRECLKNHAASLGGHILDGCGEFMASGEEGTREALICAACDCHRNFHRKEVNGEPLPLPPTQSQYHPYNPSLHRPNRSLLAQKHPKQYSNPETMVNFGGGAAAESSSEELNTLPSADGRHVPGSKKRFRTKFSQQQKDQMQEFAEKIDWRIQKQDDEELQQFCSEVGVKRQVFKVWMHNNKQALKRKEN